MAALSVQRLGGGKTIRSPESPRAVNTLASLEKGQGGLFILKEGEQLTYILKID